MGPRALALLSQLPLPPVSGWGHLSRVLSHSLPPGSPSSCQPCQGPNLPRRRPLLLLWGHLFRLKASHLPFLAI